MAEREKKKLIHEGKAKKVFSLLSPYEVLIEFKDDLTAFNGLKKSSFEKKSFYNKNITSLSFRFLESRGFKTHFIEETSPISLICKNLKIIPLEVVIRNTLAGSIVKRLGLPLGEKLKKPLVEFYYKNDKYQDPLINKDHVFLLSLLEEKKDLEKIERLALDINKHLIDFFDFVDIDLIDFKLEFGWDSNDEIVLGDEISPDTCRLWDQKTGFILDKDRFRNDLGKVEESYKQVSDRLEEKWRDLV